MIAYSLFDDVEKNPSFESLATGTELTSGYYIWILLIPWFYANKELCTILMLTMRFFSCVLTAKQRQNSYTKRCTFALNLSLACRKVYK